MDVHGMAVEGPGGMVFVVSEHVGRVGSGTRTNKDRKRARPMEEAEEADEGGGEVAEGMIGAGVGGRRSTHVVPSARRAPERRSGGVPTPRHVVASSSSR